MGLPMNEVFHQNLRQVRIRRRISQKQVAADLYISQALLSHYENGIREPGLDFVSRVCSYYGVTADFLLGHTEESEVRLDSQALETLLQTVRQLEASLLSLDEQLVQHTHTQSEAE